MNCFGCNKVANLEFATAHYFEEWKLWFFDTKTKRFCKVHGAVSTKKVNSGVVRNAYPTVICGVLSGYTIRFF